METNETKQILSPCKNCGLPIKQGGHWNDILCLHALKNRVSELEEQVERQKRLVPVSHSLYTEQESEMFGSPGDGEIDVRGKE